jgi:hypothetical protein
MAQTVKKMKTDKFMYLPTMTEDEFTKNVGKEDFFRRFGNPAVIRTQAGEGYIVLSAELYDRMEERCGFPGTKELIDREPRT